MSLCGYTQSIRRPQLNARQVRNANQCAHNLRNIVRDDLGQFPDDETAIRSDAGQAVAVDGHVGDRRLRREDRRKLQKGAVSARAGDNANTTCANWLETAKDAFQLCGEADAPLVIAYATH